MVAHKKRLLANAAVSVIFQNHILVLLCTPGRNSARTIAVFLFLGQFCALHFPSIIESLQESPSMKR
ncbi:hypothetical protein PTHTG4_29930 [Parageobacillus thermoglucosidasius]|nr:hypothetical protein PTHTG4_29930 [Parageobacillus thermoglucosidasius]